MTMECNTKNYRVSRLCSLSGILNTRKRDVFRLWNIGFLVFRIPDDEQNPETE
jgi:hypothetical protein